MHTYIDSRHDHLCRCEGCRPQPPEHSELCGCAECITEYSASGQTDPYGFVVSVSWELGSVTNAEWHQPEDFTVTREMREEMDALVARIDGRRFASAADLVKYLRRVTGTRDFD